MEAEIVQVKLETTIPTYSDELVNLVYVSGFPEGGHPHHLVFSLVHLKAQKSRKGAVKKSQRVGKADLFKEFDLRTLSYPETGRRPFSYTVDSQYGRFLKRGAEKGAGRVREVVLTEENLGRRHAKPPLDKLLDPELIPEPRYHCLPKYAVGAGEGLHAGQDKPLELDERLLEKDHIVQVGRPDPARPEAEINGALRKLIVVLLPGEPLLLGGSNKLTIAQQGRRRIVEVAGDTEYMHPNLLSELLRGPLHRDFHLIVPGTPASGSGHLDRQRITKPADPQGKRTHDQEVENREESPRLEVADFPRNSLPPFPNTVGR